MPGEKLALPMQNHNPTKLRLAIRYNTQQFNPILEFKSINSQSLLIGKSSYRFTRALPCHMLQI